MDGLIFGAVAVACCGLPAVLLLRMPWLKHRRKAARDRGIAERSKIDGSPGVVWESVDDEPEVDRSRLK